MNAMAKIEELALRVAEDALGPNSTPEDRREALKILNAHYTMLLKSKVKSEGDSDEPNFNDFAETLNGIATKN
jgi:hypothetical protein